jgi:raffinose/stachyose/melibiose transport system permease protein
MGKEYMMIKMRKKFGFELFMVIFTLLIMYPLFNLLNISLKTTSEMIKSPLSITTDFHFENYVIAFEKMRYVVATVNSLIVTSVSVFIGIIAYTLAGYAISRAKQHKWFFSGVLFVFVVGMTLPPQSVVTTIVPWLNFLGMNNTRVGLILVFVGAFSSYGIFLISQFMKTVPAELEESAIIDGAGPFCVYRHITLPLLNPAIVTLVTLTSVDTWNNLLFPLIILQGVSKRTVPLAIIFAKGEFVTYWNEFFAGMILTLIPILIFFMITQKKMISNLTAGALKF